jgi:FG-GAP-like repeat
VVVRAQRNLVGESWRCTTTSYVAQGGYRIGGSALERLFVVLMTLVCILYLTSSARADVDTTGGLREVSPISSLGGVKPLVSAENEDYECTAKYSDLQSGAFTWVIGNCAKGTTLEAVVRRLHSDSEPNGDYSLGGWVGGEVQGCGWIEDEKFKPKTEKHKVVTSCSELSGGSYEVPESNFMSKHNSGAGDGYYVVNKKECPEYANYRPWSSSNVEKEKLRTEPAYAASSGSVPALKWRYTTKYNSIDGSGQYVMVRDVNIAAGEGNWVFVPRSCLPSTLPENESERNPPPPTVTTGGYSSVEAHVAVLHGTVNPNGLDAKYHFEYGTTTSLGVSTSEGDAGSGSGNIEESAAITALSQYTTYYYRIVATSATGTSYGGITSFMTQAVPPTVTTSAAQIQFRRATLNGTVNPNGAPTQFYYQYGLTSSYGSVTSEGSAGSGLTSVTAPIVATGLELNTTYHFRVVASNPGGTSYGGDETLRTAAPPSLSISKPAQSSLPLSWIASTNAVNYSITRNGLPIGSTSGLTYTDSKLDPSTFYRYEVVANDESESAGSSAVTRATTPVSSVTTDVNDDGKTDLLYFYPGGYIDSFLSAGTGTYEGKQELVSKEFDTVGGLWLAGDFSGDGRSDLAYIYPGGYIDSFLSNGNGTYEEKQELISKEFDTTGGTWEVGDFNGDGKADLAYIFDNYIDTFLSNGNGTYEIKQQEVSKEFSSTGGQWEVGDFNGDGKADLDFIVNNYIDTFLSKGNGTYEEKLEEVSEAFDSVTGIWL